ncbi:MAG: hypothetical protein C0402_16365 [Thermodesulfovibrio sp.]|nr:hypothetical protein [Thermodesulfovibrio sp.]
MEVRPGYKRTEVGVIPEDWDATRLVEVCSMKSGEGITSTNIDEGAQYPCYGGNGLRGLTSRFTHDGNYALIGRQGALCGNVLGVSGKFFASEHAVVVTALAKTDISWLTFVLGRMRLNQYAESSAQPGLSVSKLLELRLPLPTFPEQRAIATALSDVDALLAKLDQLIAKKRDLKQAAMQQLLTGQTRLPGFSVEWEVKRLGEVGNCLRGVTYKGDSDLSPYDTAHTKRLLRSNNVQNSTVVTTDIQFVNSERVSEKQLLRECDILICMANGSKALVGKAGFFSISDGYEYTFGAFMGCFRPSIINANTTFVFFLFQTGRYRNYINNLLAGSSINNLTPTSIESLEFSIPSLPEQTAIATVLSDMDAEIAALEARREKTRSLKQGMMQELLTGRIRLV